MRWRISIGVLLALALVIPAPLAVAQTGSPRSTETTCQVVEYTDIRELVTIDLDAASDTEVRVLAFRVLNAATEDSLRALNGALQERLAGTVDGLRAFLKTDMQVVWSEDLQVEVFRTLPGAGANVQAAAGRALTSETIDAYLAYLNNDLYVARALDAGWSLKEYTDIRELVTIDLDAASDTEVRVLAFRVLNAATEDSLRALNGALQERLAGTVDGLRAFLKSDMQVVWSEDLQVEVFRTLSGAGANVQAAAGRALTSETIDAYLAYLNNDLYVARALDACASQSAQASSSAA